MPIGAGMMLISRIQLEYPEFMLSITADGYDGYANLGSAITAVITSNIAVNQGSYSLVREDGYSYGIAIPTLNGNPNIDLTSSFDGYHYLQIVYDGYAGQYQSSVSNIVGYYLAKPRTIVTISGNTVSSFDHTAPTDIIASVIVGSLDVSTGVVLFRLYTNNLIFIDLGTFPVISNIATGSIPAGTTTAGTTYYLAAYYTSSNNISSGVSPIGTAGYSMTAT